MSAGITNMGLGDASAATGFDPQSYLQANPDLQPIVAQYPNFNLLQHYQLYGIPEGRAKSVEEATARAKAPVIPAQAGPALSGSGGASWENYLRAARQQTLGLNNLPTMAPTSDQIPAARAAAKAMFALQTPPTPPASLWGGAAAGPPPGMYGAPLPNMGMGGLGSPALTGNVLAGGAAYSGG